MLIYLKYARAVVRHKWFVFRACQKAGIPVRGFLHDLSKFRPSEFVAYARYFGVEKSHRTKEIIAAFERANRLHEMRNPHHHEYWIRIGDDGSKQPNPMDLPSLVEMICDWRAVGLAFKGVDDSNEYWASARDRLCLHPESREWVERHFALQVAIEEGD